VRIVGGTWRGRRLVELEGDRIRPTADRVREAWMSAMGGRFDGVRVLDLCAGSGALGLECLSRGAAHVTFVDASPASLEVLRANLDLVGVDASRVTVVRADAIEWLRGAFEPAGERDEPAVADLALADPPYDTDLAARLVRQWETRPFAGELWLEHRSSDSVESPLVRRARAYGGTTITTLTTPSDA